ncbi:MAG TPA: hypothetical protein VJH04_00290, partial [archaeon]|nr:hypothetical protein [archaeon]
TCQTASLFEHKNHCNNVAHKLQDATGLLKESKILWHVGKLCFPNILTSGSSHKIMSSAYAQKAKLFGAPENEIFRA